MGILGIIAAIILICIIIFIHEFGHYIAGKLSGCSVSQFSIGWGPNLFSFKRKETEYKISWLPLIGGYVRLPGMEGEGGQLTEQEQKDLKKYNLKTFRNLKTWQKFLIFVGGAALQIIFCILILTFLISIMGKPVSQVIIADVSEDSPAQIADIRKFDRIIEADGKRIDSAKKLIEMTADRADKKITLLIKREGEFKQIELAPEYSKELNRAVIGVQIAEAIDYEKENMNWSDYVFGGVIFTGRLTAIIIQAVWFLLTRQISLRALSGPVEIVALTGEVVKTGFLQSLLFLAVININLAILNLLPFPALDGGHVLLLSIEKVFRIKIKPRIKEILNTIGFILLIFLILYITFYDITGRIAKREEESERPQKIETQVE
jgi:regulator of sigma E protease